MFRRLMIPAACAALLAGCMTSGYSYRADRGDYYYGQPQVEYRYYGGYDDGFGWPGYHGPYRSRYPGYGYGRFSFGYGHPGWDGRYGSGWGGYPYSNNWPRYRHRYPRPPSGYQPRPDRDSRDGSPWRNLDDLRRRQTTGPIRQDGGNDRRVEPSAPRMEPRAERRDRGDSNLGRMIRESREAPRRDAVITSEQEP